MIWLNIGKKSETGIHFSVLLETGIYQRRKRPITMNAIWLVLLQKTEMAEKAYMRKQIDVARDGGGIARGNCGVSG